MKDVCKKGSDGYRVPVSKKIMGTDGYRVTAKFSIMTTPGCFIQNPDSAMVNFSFKYIISISSYRF